MSSVLSHEKHRAYSVDRWNLRRMDHHSIVGEAKSRRCNVRNAPEVVTCYMLPQPEVYLNEEKSASAPRLIEE